MEVQLQHTRCRREFGWSLKRKPRIKSHDKVIMLFSESYLLHNTLNIRSNPPNTFTDNIRLISVLVVAHRNSAVSAEVVLRCVLFAVEHFDVVVLARSRHLDVEVREAQTDGHVGRGAAIGR